MEWCETREQIWLVCPHAWWAITNLVSDDPGMQPESPDAHDGTQRRDRGLPSVHGCYDASGHRGLARCSCLSLDEELSKRYIFSTVDEEWQSVELKYNRSVRRLARNS